MKDGDYKKRINEVLKTLEDKSSKYLSKEALATYSPKYLNILENISDDNNKGIHLLYSQFKTLEGIGIFKLVLKANGYEEFKLIKDSNGQYTINVDKSQLLKPMFASYSGDESPEEREIIKNVLNGGFCLHHY